MPVCEGSREAVLDLGTTGIIAESFSSEQTTCFRGLCNVRQLYSIKLYVAIGTDTMREV